MILTISHVTSMHDWNDDRIFERACCGLVSAGYSVKLIATHDTKSPFTETGVEVIPIKRRSGIRRRIFSSIEATLKASRTNASIIHFHDPDLLPFMLILSLFRKGVVYDIHENYVARISSLSYPASINGILLWLWRKFEKTCIRSFTGFTVTTHSMGQMFGLGNVPYCVISNTPFLKRLNLEQIADVQKREGVTLFISGSHSKQRNCMQAIEALPFIVKEHPEVQLVFAGKYVPDGYKQELKEKAEQLGVGKHIQLEGMLPWLDNFNRTASMHIGLVLYEDNPNNRVTIPNRLFEYMISGLAVVGEDFTEVKKVIEDANCGYICNSAEPQEIARAVIATIEDKRGLVQLGMNGKNAILNKYAFEYDLKRLIVFYQQLSAK